VILTHIPGGSFRMGSESHQPEERFLHPNCCSRYRPAARQPQEVDLSAAHLGFRTVLYKPNSLSSYEGRKP